MCARKVVVGGGGVILSRCSVFRHAVAAAAAAYARLMSTFCSLGTLSLGEGVYFDRVLYEDGYKLTYTYIVILWWVYVYMYMYIGVVNGAGNKIRSRCSLVAAAAVRVSVNRETEGV